MNICHVITSLEVGGAQSMLYQLVRDSQSKQQTHTVISLTAHRHLQPAFEALGVDTHILDLGSLYQWPGAFLKVVRLLRQLSPDIVHTWLYRADLMGGLAASAANVPATVWGIHHGALGHGSDGMGTRLLVKLNRRLSGILPDRIVYCSKAAYAAHRAVGYDDRHSLVIPNGIDTERFRPDLDSKARLLSILGLQAPTRLIGLVARYHPVKRHDTFLRAAALLRQTCPESQFVLCGGGTELGNQALSRLIVQQGLDQVVHRLGQRDDVAAITAGLDIATCCSETESFSLTMAEAMACNIPCVSSDIPGPRSVMGSMGQLFPVGDHHALARAWERGLAFSATERETPRERIVNQFSLRVMIDRYRSLYDELL